jgi:NADPH-dependent 2,4-dienoyl-CoA reductase/sulfur reductase-like enzyme
MHRLNAVLNQLSPTAVGESHLKAVSTSAAHYDVIIVGGGVMGASAAVSFARRGRKALLIEQFEPGHDRGSSHGDGRIYRYAYREQV